MDFKKLWEKLTKRLHRSHGDRDAESQSATVSSSKSSAKKESPTVKASSSTSAQSPHQTDQASDLPPEGVVPAEDVPTASPAPDDEDAGTEPELTKKFASNGTGNEHKPSPNTLSQELWDEAYVSIETDPKNESLIINYVAALRRFLTGGKDDKEILLAEAVALSKELNDKTKRNEYLQKLVTNGKDKIEKAAKVSKVIGDVAEGVLKLQPVMDIVLKVPQAAPAALPWAGVCVGLQMLANPKMANQANLDGMSHLVQMMEWYCAIVEHLLEPSSVESAASSTKSVLSQLRPRVVELYKGVLFYQMWSVCTYYKNQGWNFVRQLGGLDKWTASVASVDSAEKDLVESWATYDQIKARKVEEEHVALTRNVVTLLEGINQTIKDVVSEQKRIRSDDKATACLQHLRPVNPIDDMTRIEEDGKEKLMDDTFKWVFEEDDFIQFTNWTNAKLPQRRLLWISGKPGAGKTMLLISIIRKLSNQSAGLSPGLSYFFCQSKAKTYPPMNNLAAALRSLMWLLIIQQPNLISYLEKDYNDSGEKLFTDSNQQQAMRRIFKTMLENADPIYFIVDALDECEEGQDHFINLISDSLVASEKVRWLVTSRPEVNLVGTLNDRHKKGLLHPLTLQCFTELDMHNRKDRVSKYVQQKLVDLKDSIYGQTYRDEDLHRISRKVNDGAYDNMLWVRLVFQDLVTMTCIDALKHIGDYPPGLEELYKHKMASLKNGGTKHLDWCKDVLVATSLAYRPLTLDELACLVPWSSKLEPRTVVPDCKAFITIFDDNKISVIHKSALDYLVHNQAELQGGNIKGHADIARSSIEAMKKTLRYDIYGTRQYGLKPKDLKPPKSDPLRRIGYSCVFWVEHLCSLEYRDAVYQKQLLEDLKILSFLEEHLLNWLESLSLLGKLSDGVGSMRKLQQKLQHYDSASELGKWFEEAEKFVLCYGKIIKRAPLQTYGAALAFSPALSKIKHSYWPPGPPFDFIMDVYGPPKHWPQYQQTFNVREAAQMSFSQDNMTLAVAPASYNGQVELWDTITGTLKRTIDCVPGDEPQGNFSHHSSEIMAFSPVDTILATVPVEGDSKTRLWNTETGVLEQTLDLSDVPKLTVFSVTFAPDGKSLATASSDKQVRLWNIDRATSDNLFQFNDDGQSLAFSPDGELLVAGPSISGSYLQTKTDTTDGIRLWDIANAVPRGALKGHTKSITALVFSPDQDSNTLASSSRDSTVRIWNTAKNTCCKPLEHPLEVYSAVFSRDGQQLVTAWYSGIWLWDVASGTQVATIGLFPHEMGAFAFTSDGSILAAQKKNWLNVQFWDTVANGKDSPLENTKSPSLLDEILGVGISTGGRLLALKGSKNLYVWNVAENTCEHIIEYYDELKKDDDVCLVAFSADDRRIVHLDYSAVELYDTEAGTQVRKFVGRAPALSPDAMTVGLILPDETIQLWNLSANSGFIVKPEDKVLGIVFSPDGAKIASFSVNTIQIWNTTDGAHMKTLSHDMETGCATFFAFSSDCKYFAVYGENHLQLWDCDRDVVRDISNKHREDIFNTPLLSPMTFSHSGNMLAVATHKEIRIWDLAFDTPKYIFNSDLLLHRLAFSNDDSRLHTNGGMLDIPRESGGHIEVSNASALFVQRRWIHFGPEEKLWLPEEYQLGSLYQQQFAVSKGIVVVAFWPYSESPSTNGGFYMVKCTRGVE